MRIGDEIAAMDQAQAAARRWAVIFAAMRDELIETGVTVDVATDIAREWMLEILARDDG